MACVGTCVERESAWAHISAPLIGGGSGVFELCYNESARIVLVRQSKPAGKGEREGCAKTF